MKNVVVLFTSLLCSLVLAELGLRLADQSFPVFMHPDPILGWSLRPGMSGWSREESPAYLQINRFGFRGREWAEKRPAAVFRIAVVGDSFVEAQNLPDEQSLTALIENNATSCAFPGSNRVEVLNFGVSGYGTTQEYLTLDHRVASFQPQVVLFVLYVGNDIEDNNRVLSIESERNRPYFVELPSGELQLDDSFRNDKSFQELVASDWRRELRNSSYVLQLINRSRKAIAAFREQGLVFNDPLNRKLYSPPQDDTWRSAWSVTEKTLIKARDWAHQRGLGFELVIVPSPEQALPTEKLRRENATTLNLDDLDYPVHHIVQFAAQANISYLSLLEPLRAYVDRKNLFAYGFPPNFGYGHLNATGNEVAGREIADHICDLYAKVPPRNYLSSAPRSN
jgi:hypothetical protein